MAKGKTGTNNTDLVRKAIVNWTGGQDIEFKVRDVTEAIDDGTMECEVKNGAVISNALRSWADRGLIVSGYKLEHRQDRTRGVLRYRLTPISQSQGTAGPPAVAKTGQAKAVRRQVVGGQKIELEVIQLRENGEALVRRDNQLFTLKRFDW